MLMSNMSTSCSLVEADAPSLALTKRSFSPVLSEMAPPATRSSSRKPEIIGPDRQSPQEPVIIKNSKANDSLYTHDEDVLLRNLKEVQKKDWREIEMLFNQQFPDKSRTRGSLQVRYSRSLQPGKKSRPLEDGSDDTRAPGPSQVPRVTIDLTKTIDPETENSSNTITTTKSGRRVKGTAKVLTKQFISNPRARSLPTGLRPSAKTIEDSTRFRKGIVDWNAEDQALLDEALKDVRSVSGWDHRKQGQPPLVGLTARKLAGPPKRRGRFSSQAASRRAASAPSLQWDSPIILDEQKPPHKRCRDELETLENSERPIKQARPPGQTPSEIVWRIVHPVALPLIIEGDIQIPWAQKFPGPNRIIEQHATRPDHFRLRSRRAGELQPLPPRRDGGIWDFVGADTTLLGVHSFENCPYGSNWVFRMTTPDW